MPLTLRTLSRYETESLAAGRPGADGPDGPDGLADLLPEVVLRAALDHADRGFPWALCAPRLFIEPETGRAVGSGCLFPVSEAEAELGYGTRPECAGRGVATAGVALLLREALGERPGLAVVAKTAAANPASGRVLEKNGFMRCGTGHDPEDGDLILWRRG